MQSNKAFQYLALAVITVFTTFILTLCSPTSVIPDRDSRLDMSEDQMYFLMKLASESKNETAACFNASLDEDDGTIRIDSVKKATILDSSPSSVRALPCGEGYNGFYHSHPDFVALSRTDMRLSIINDVEYMMISVGGFAYFGLWHRDYIKQKFGEGRKVLPPQYFITLSEKSRLWTYSEKTRQP